MNTTLNKKNALITGATGGLGSEIASALANNGVKVFLTGRNRSSLLSLSKDLGNRCLGFLECNLESEEEIVNLVECAQRFASFPSGSIDILINCAGVFPTGMCDESSIQDFDRCFNVNVRAPFLLSKLSYEYMRDHRWGRIVNIGSSSSYSGFSNTSLYCASKHALLGLSRSLYNEFKSDGVRVFSVSPGSIQTKMGEKVLDQNYSTFMEPCEVAKFICELISYDSNMISEEVRLNRVFIE